LEELQFTIDNEPLTIRAECNSDSIEVEISAGASYALSAVRSDESSVTFTAAAIGPDGSRGPSRRLELPYAEIRDTILFSWQGNVYRVARNRGVAAAASPAQSSGSVSAPTGGVVADLLVTVGQEVEVYQPVAVIESMKVMTPIDALIAGRVAELFVERGQRIEQGAAIARIEPREAS